MIYIDKLSVLQQVKENSMQVNAFRLFLAFSFQRCLSLIWEWQASPEGKFSWKDHKMLSLSLIVSSPQNALLLLVGFPFSPRHRIVLILLNSRPLCLFYPRTKRRRNKMIGALIRRINFWSLWRMQFLLADGFQARAKDINSFFFCFLFFLTKLKGMNFNGGQLQFKQKHFKEFMENSHSVPNTCFYSV